MTTAEFAQFALRERVAPRAIGSVKQRLERATRDLVRRNWSRNRVRDLWYADPRASAPQWTEIADLEELTGLKYARQEVRTNDQIIAYADALLMGGDPDFVGPFVAAIRALLGAVDRAGVARRTDKTD